MRLRVRVYLPLFLALVLGCGESGDVHVYPALPTVEHPAHRPEKVIRAAYYFVADRPDVVAHIPCFCGCERYHHSSVADCFVTRRHPDGTIEWNDHGMSCGVCVDVVRDVKALAEKRVALVKIRQRIDDKYIVQFGSSMNTPRPAAR